MAVKRATQDKATRTITVQVALQTGAGQAPPKTRAYVFDRAGRLVDSKPASGKAVEFEVAASQDYRVTVGPDLIGDAKRAPANLAAQLAQSKSVSQDSLAQAKSAAINFKVYPNIWICWFPTCINVHGTVRKLLNPGGTPAQYAPICTGTVQIFQVDLGCTLDKFTVVELTRLKASLIDRLTLPVSEISKAVAFKPPAPGGPVELRAAATRVSSAVPAAASSSASFSEVAANLSALNGAALKQYIVSQNLVLWPFWCELIPDSAFCWQELTEVPIQSDGSFSAEICFWCPADYPDLYFEVVQNLSGVETEISDPQIACSTYYNYDGSQSVDITVDDPRAVACQPTGGQGPDYLFVWPTAIGNVDLKYIDGLETLTGTGEVPQTSPFGVVENGAWGGTLDLQMIFHPDLQANNIKYYRWSYQFDGEPDFTQIHATVTHRYQTITISGTDIVIHLNPVTLGPQLVSGPSNPGGTSNLFAIPDPTLPWVDINDPVDRPFAYFDSTGGVTPRKSGMCTLMLELFDGDGKFVPCNNVRGLSNAGDQASDPGGPGAFTFILPEIGGPPDTYTNAPKPNVTDHGRLIFRVRVDNNATDSELPKVSTPVNSTDTDPCGILEYNTTGDNVAIYYVAYHPNNYLDWELWVSKGVTGVVASIPPSPPPNNTSAGSPGLPTTFNNTAGALLGTCTQAAFAVNLYCWARITDGYSRQSEYDSSRTIAFALTKPCVTS